MSASPKVKSPQARTRPSVSSVLIGSHIRYFHKTPLQFPHICFFCILLPIIICTSANLLEIVSANNIEINEHLRRAILGEELYNEAECKTIRRQTFSKRESILGALVRSHESDVRDSVKDTQIASEIRDKLERGGINTAAKFEVRIRDGSYTVEAAVAQEGNKGPGQQHIETVSNSGVFIKIGRAMRRLVKTGSARQKTESKTIMDGINLVLEEGKMYLILGPPGCGKSTCKCSVFIFFFSSLFW